MDHKDHLALIEKAVSGSGIWADLGSGRGAFTLALAELLGPGSQIYSLDRDRAALAKQARRAASRYPHVQFDYLAQDFTGTLDLPPLDGILMANSLHFVRRKAPLLKRLLAHLNVGGRFVLVEYNAERGNPWVPHPLSYPAWEKLSAQVGLAATRKIGAYPSRFLGEIYASDSRRV
jgi:SAM-dependent methyltransferase